MATTPKPLANQGYEPYDTIASTTGQSVSWVKDKGINEAIKAAAGLQSFSLRPTNWKIFSTNDTEGPSESAVPPSSPPVLTGTIGAWFALSGGVDNGQYTDISVVITDPVDIGCCWLYNDAGHPLFQVPTHASKTTDPSNFITLQDCEMSIRVFLQFSESVAAFAIIRDTTFMIPEAYGDPADNSLDFPMDGSKSPIGIAHKAKKGEDKDVWPELAIRKSNGTFYYQPNCCKASHT